MRREDSSLSLIAARSSEYNRPQIVTTGLARGRVLGCTAWGDVMRRRAGPAI